MRFIFWAMAFCSVFVFVGAEAGVTTFAATTNSTSSEPAMTSPSQTAAPVMPPPPTTSITPSTAKEPIPQLDPNFKVTKVHEVNNTESYKDGGNDDLVFEKAYWNYGAVTAEEKEARRGQIYVISWKNSGAAADLTTKFEYRQVKTRDIIHVQTLAFPKTNGSNRSIFQVVGAEYRTNGPVYSWRFTIWRGSQLVAAERSFVW